MKGITTTEKGDMALLQWCMSAFNVIEHPQEGIYILLEGSMKWQDCTDTYELSPTNFCSCAVATTRSVPVTAPAACFGYLCQTPFCKASCNVSVHC